jgi:hypothetical protein
MAPELVVNSERHQKEVQARLDKLLSKRLYKTG